MRLRRRASNLPNTPRQFPSHELSRSKLETLDHRRTDSRFQLPWNRRRYSHKASDQAVGCWDGSRQLRECETRNASRHQVTDNRHSRASCPCSLAGIVISPLRGSIRVVRALTKSATMTSLRCRASSLRCRTQSVTASTTNPTSNARAIIPAIRRKKKCSNRLRAVTLPVHCDLHNPARLHEPRQAVGLIGRSSTSGLRPSNSAHHNDLAALHRSARSHIALLQA